MLDMAMNQPIWVLFIDPIFMTKNISRVSLML